MILILLSLQESCSPPWCSDPPVASSSAPSALSSMWILFSLTQVSSAFRTFLCEEVLPGCGLLTRFTPPSADVLGITPDDPRWIGAWWGGFLLCGALLFLSALFMFGFPHSLPKKERDEGTESEQVMLPPPLSPDSETPKPSNGVVLSSEPVNSATCCQQLRGERVALRHTKPPQTSPFLSEHLFSSFLVCSGSVIPKVTKHLLSNPVFTCIVLAACMEVAVVAGFAAFLGKYLEQQFNLTTTSANQLLGQLLRANTLTRTCN